MAFTLEDGTGITGANAFVSVAELDDYAADRNIDLTAQDEASKQAAIIQASADFIDVYYNIKGEALTDTQGMQIPTDEVGVTANVKKAAIEGALLAFKDRLLVDASLINTTGQVTSEKKKVDVIETETTYAESRGQYIAKYPTVSIDRLMRPYVTSQGMGRLMII